jgi:T-complex protein 1 subunit zeta
MAAISLLNPKAEFARAAQALSMNISAAKGIHDVMKTNLGPKGTLKM